jgi:hypothetical protein
MNGILKILMIAIGAVLTLVGLVVVYAAPAIVDKKGLAANRKVDPKILEHMPPEEIDRYRRDGAILDLKIKGVAFAVPGMLLIVIALR